MTYLALDHPVAASASVVAAVLVTVAALAVIRLGFNDAYLDERLVSLTLPGDAGLDILRPAPPAEPAGFGAAQGGRHARTAGVTGRHRPRPGCRYVSELCVPTPTRGDLEWANTRVVRRRDAARRAPRYRWPRSAVVTCRGSSIDTWVRRASGMSLGSLYASSWVLTSE